jgi:hypothetical protein
MLDVVIKANKYNIKLPCAYYRKYKLRRSPSYATNKFPGADKCLHRQLGTVELTNIYHTRAFYHLRRPICSVRFPFAQKCGSLAQASIFF